MNEKPSYEELKKRILELEKSESKKKAQIEKLKNTNRILEGVLNGIQDIIGIQNPDHTMVRYNKAGYESLNMTSTEVAGLPCYSLIGRTIPCENCATDRALDSKRLEVTERFVPELGRYFICRSNPVLDESGRVTHIIEQLHDITERKNLEQEKDNLIAELQAALAENKVLRGLIPICAHCKKVRSDEGYWKQIEDYLLDYSDARFSHCICPECAKKLYPDYDIYDEDENVG
ncbi:MAG: PAS domain-containing protein [Bacteroidetes bacterium]|jgi:transcriptional regulator with PAS, ATPase and Fis domain|nr:PAS domain-containing protein [Bacteroidota bacterium]